MKKNLALTAVVMITADKMGNVVIPSKENPEWGHVRVEQTRFIVEDGFGREKKISALIQGKVKELTKQYKSAGELPGTIIFKESLTPFNKKEPAHDFKMAGTSGIVCKYNSAPIYRKTFYVQDENTPDQPLMSEDGELLKHTNTEEIKAAYAAQKASTASSAGIDA